LVSKAEAEVTPTTLPRAQATSRPENYADVLIVGAGPTGLACAIEVQKIGKKAIILDKGCIVNSIYNYPANLIFFTTPELLEIGDIPFSTANLKPNRQEALEYYRRVAERYHLHICQYQWVKTITGEDDNFRVTATDRSGRIHDYKARKIIVCTGYYDLPNKLNVPGEDLPKVYHYFREPHPFYDSDVAVIGGRNSAAEAALELWRRGARVTLIYRGAGVSSHIKYWVRPDLENRIKNGEIAVYFNASVERITLDHVEMKTREGPVQLKNDFVFALVGYHPDYDFLQSVGIELSKEQHRPVSDPETLESNVPGVYVAGVIVAGSRTSEIFIENGRFHGKQIALDLKAKLQ
jgi:thioredoxin reductase (NADPH)